MSPFNLGKGKYKHRISEDVSYKDTKHLMRSYRLDPESIEALEEIARLYGTNKSAAIRIVLRKAHEEMTNAEHVA